jgi:hypothetical protein
LQDTRPASEAKAVEVVRNHEDGTRRRCGRRFPKVALSQEREAGSGLRCRQYDGGAFFGQSQERQFSRATGWTDGSGRCRASRHRRSGGLRRRVFTHSRATRAKVLEDAPFAPANGKRPEGSGKADVPRLRAGTSPHLAACPPSGRTVAKVARGTAGISARRSRSDPEGPMNPIPDRLPDSSASATLHAGSRRSRDRRACEAERSRSRSPRQATRGAAGDCDRPPPSAGIL